MARPVKEGMDYFPHDTDASNDEKLEILTSLYGNDGYAFYFILLERIYRQKDFQIDISNIETKKVLSKKIRVSLPRFEKILESSIIATLFNPDLAKSGILTSDGIKKRANALISKRLDMQERRNKKAVNSPQTQQQTQQETHQQTIPQSTQSKVKESKEKKIKESSIEDKKIDDDDFFDEVQTMPITDNLSVQSEGSKDCDDDFISDLVGSGLTRQQAIDISSKYPNHFIGLKLDQVRDQAKSGTIKNLPAYILKTFENAEFECNQEMSKINEKRKEEQRRINEQAKFNEMVRQKEDFQYNHELLIKITDEMMERVTPEIRQKFLNEVVEPSYTYKALYNREGFDNFVIDSHFREFIYNYFQKEEAC